MTAVISRGTHCKWKVHQVPQACLTSYLSHRVLAVSVVTFMVVGLTAVAL